MTQAISAARILERDGHEIVAVTLGASSVRTVPAFFQEAFGERLWSIPNPGFNFRHGRGVAPLATLWQAVAGLGRCRHGLRTLGRLVERNGGVVRGAVIHPNVAPVPPDLNRPGPSCGCCGDRPMQTNAPGTLEHDYIASRAHALWEQAGRPGGRDLDFWLAAENEFFSASAASPPARVKPRPEPARRTSARKRAPRTHAA